MNRITLFLLTFAILINVLLIIVEATLTRTLHLCPSSVSNGSGSFMGLLFSTIFQRGCYSTESK